MLDNLKRYSRLMFLSVQIVAGRKFWIVILLPLLWPALIAAFILLGSDIELKPANAQMLMAIPLAFMGMGFGVRIIAGEIDGRTLEISYTVPGGCHRVWLAKIWSSICLLVASEIILAVVILAFFLSSIPFVALYGSLQASVFYMVAGMAFSAFFKSEITGAMAAVALFAFNALIGFGDFQPRISPFFNPFAIENMDSAQRFAYTLQNRILFIILVVALTLLTFSRVERREKMLGD